ncbi:MAG: membrane protein insertion efficiency factor YidD [Bacteroidota bacterium]
MDFLFNIFKKIVIFPLRFYQVAISPLLGANCRFTPTCSHYMIQAIEEWGVLKGIYLGTKRLLKCHPWGPSGHDPVPKKKSKKTT